MMDETLPSPDSWLEAFVDPCNKALLTGHPVFYSQINQDVI
jgi:hypothetical protein